VILHKGFLFFGTILAKQSLYAQIFVQRRNIMSMNIPKDPLSHTAPAPTGTPPSPASSISTRDSLATFMQEETNTRLTREAAAPELKVPQEGSDTSIVGAFRTWTEAIRAFREQLSASDQANLDSRSKMSQLAATQAAEMSKILEQKAAAIAKLQEEINKQLGDLQKQLDEMRELLRKQQEGIDQVNNGNGEEKRQYEELTRAYDTYVAQLKMIGVVERNGEFIIPEAPPEVLEYYNKYTSEYQKAVAKFNNYFPGRLEQIKKYNEGVDAYNQKVAEYNNAVNEFISKHNLSGYLVENGLTIPILPPASKRDISGYKEMLDAPPPLSSIPANVPSHRPPDYAYTIGRAGPPEVPKLSQMPPFATQLLYTKMYNDGYQKAIAPFDQEILQFTAYWSYLTRQMIQNFDRASGDSLLNTKSLAQRIFPPSLLISKPSQPSSISGGMLAMDSLNMGSSHLQAVLGKSLLKEAIEQSSLQALEGLNQEDREAKVDHLVDQILLLSIGLLSNESLQALFPSLGVISDSLATLPKDSPAFAILFAVSLSNRIQEDVSQGTTDQALQTFIETNPELAALPAEDKENLLAALNIGLLLVAGKLLEDNLGLQGLLTQILPSLVPTIDPNLILLPAAQENMEGRTERYTQIQEHFVEQGYSEDQALFLAETGVELAEAGLLTPNATSNISSQTINQPLLINSIKADLVLSKYPLQEADFIANEAVNQTFAEGPSPSIKQFRATLESHLADLQVKTSPQIAAAAVLIPPAEQSLTRLTVLQTPPVAERPLETIPEGADAAVAVAPEIAIGTPTTTTRPASETPDDRTVVTPPASEPAAALATAPLPLPNPLLLSELVSILKKRSLQLLVPQLGATLANQVSEEIAKTLFGHLNPDTHDVADIKSPYSLVNVMQDQLDHLHFQHDQDWANAVTETFKEGIKTMESFYAFSLKIMDPAYLFVFASGIIYGDQGRNKSIDIPI
jgi:hypothetical protein